MWPAAKVQSLAGAQDETALAEAVALKIEAALGARLNKLESALGDDREAPRTHGERLAALEEATKRLKKRQDFVFDKDVIVGIEAIS